MTERKHTMQIEVKLKHVHPNPNRDINNYPLSESKLEALIDSIESTSWWENLLCRPHPTKKGHVELAYGHHRIEAMRRLNDENTAVGMVQQDLSNEDMLKIMIRENLEWGVNSAVLDVEGVVAWINLLASGDIEPPVIDPKVRKSYIRMCGVATPHIQYTAKNIADDFGWALTRTQVALRLMDGIELEMFKSSDIVLRSVPWSVAEEAFSHLIQARKSVEAKVRADPTFEPAAKAARAVIGNEVKAVKSAAIHEKNKEGSVTQSKARQIAKQSKERIRKEDIKKEKAQEAKKNWGSMARAIVKVMDDVDRLVARANESVVTLAKHRAEASIRSKVAKDELAKAAKIANRLSATTAAWAQALNEDQGEWGSGIIDADYVVIEAEVLTSLPEGK